MLSEYKTILFTLLIISGAGEGKQLILYLKASARLPGLPAVA